MGSIYKKILVPLDGSRRAETVLPQVRELAELANAEIVLMSVAVDSIWDTLFMGPKLAAAMAGMEEAAANAKSYLEHVAATLEKTGVKVSTHITHGLVAESILDSAQEIHADLIVMSTCGRGQPAQGLGGSIAYQVARRSKAHVLLMCPTQPQNLRPIPTKSSTS